MPPHSTQPPLALETEEWRPVVDYEGWYEVSSFGRIKRIKPYNNTRHSRIRKLCNNGHYLNVSLDRHDGGRTRLVHRLVAEAFLGPRPDGHHAHHKNGNKMDNRASNLEWVPVHEHARNARGKLRNIDIPVIRNARGRVLQTVLARRYAVVPATISHVWNRRTYADVT